MASGFSGSPDSVQIDVGDHSNVPTSTLYPVAGDVDRGKCTGLDVNIGARIAAAAAPGEVLSSAAVQSRLTADERFVFRKRGEVELKSVPGRWSFYAVQTREEGSNDHDQGRRN